MKWESLEIDNNTIERGRAQTINHTTTWKEEEIKAVITACI